MASVDHDSNLESQEARSLLTPRHKPYWHLLDQGCLLGYYKGNESSVWIARSLQEKGRYAEQRIGLANDLAEADGVTVMDFQQARAAARNWFAERAIEEAGRPIDDGPFTSVGSPCNRA